MNLSCRYRGVEFDAPVPWGKRDEVRYVGAYAVTVNRNCGYAYVQLFKRAEFVSAFRELREGSQGDLEWLQDQVDSLFWDDFWETLVGGAAHEWSPEIIELVPKRHRKLYVDDGIVDVISIIRDYPRRVVAEWKGAS